MSTPPSVLGLQLPWLPALTMEKGRVCALWALRGREALGVTYSGQWLEGGSKREQFHFLAVTCARDHFTNPRLGLLHALGATEPVSCGLCQGRLVWRARVQRFHLERQGQAAFVLHQALASRTPRESWRALGAYLLRSPWCSFSFLPSSQASLLQPADGSQHVALSPVGGEAPASPH